MKNILKKMMAGGMIVVAINLLSGCGSANIETDDLKVFDHSTFAMKLADDWNVIGKNDFYAEIPKETLIAFSAPEAYNGFYINVNVIEENLNQMVSSLDYGRANINLSGQNLTDYQKIQEVQLDVNGEPTLLHIFQARLNPSSKLIRYIQLYTTKGTRGYIVSGGMLNDTPKELRDLVGSMVTSFRLK